LSHKRILRHLFYKGYAAVVRTEPLAGHGWPEGLTALRPLAVLLPHRMVSWLEKWMRRDFQMERAVEDIAAHRAQVLPGARHADFAHDCETLFPTGIERADEIEHGLALRFQFVIAGE